MESMKVKAEEKRNREHAERTAKLMQASKLPKRMEIHNQQESNKPKDKAKSMLVKYMAKSVPDFAKLHAKFNAKMESGRKDFKGTEPTPFALNEGKKSAAQGRTWRNAQNDPESRWKGLGTWTDDRLEAEKDKERQKKTGSFKRVFNTSEPPKVGTTKSAQLLRESTNKWKDTMAEKERQA